MSDTKEAAWQVLDRVTAMRKSLLAAGYTITPTNGKAPFLPGWQDIEVTPAEVERWARDYPEALNTGLRTRRTPGVDIDVLDPVVAQELQDLLWLMMGDNGRALVRYGLRPKRAVLFQTSEPFDKLSTSFFISPDGRKHRVEVLCDGQQFIAHGTHPDTGAAYVWEGGEPASVPRDDLPHLSEETAKEFVAKAAEVMRGHGWTAQEKKKADKKANGSATGSAAEFDALYGDGERKWAATALDGLAAELAGMAPETGRNERLYRAAFRMGTMVARNWIERATVEGRLLAACKTNGLEGEDGAHSVRASLKSGLDGGQAVPHADLVDRPTGNAATTECALKSSRASTYEMRAIQWLWPNRFALGKLGLIAGLPDEGKGQLIFDIAARCTRPGGVWPCGEGPAPFGNVILLTAEDDINDTVVPRLVAAGADLGRVEIVRMVDDNNKDRMFSLVTDIALMRQKMMEVGNVVLVLIDPITAYLGHGKIDSFRTTDVRAVLGPLTELAAEMVAAFIGVMHFNKKVDVTNALLRISDSLAFGATARHVYAAIDDDENQRKLFVKGKNNLAPKDAAKTLAYGFGAREVGHDPKTGEVIWAPHVVWHDQHVDVSATEAMQAANESKAPGARESAKKLLSDLLADGPVAQKEIEEAAGANCISTATLRRAKDDLKVTAEKEDGPKGKWFWRLPPATTRTEF